MRMLLVEDDMPLAEALAEALIDQRYVVDVVNDGEAAWQQVKALAYDLILLDMMLQEVEVDVDSYSRRRAADLSHILKGLDNSKP